MGAFEWIAVVGAAAWLPQIGLLVYRFLVEPVVHLVPVTETELTFNSQGPVFNLRAALIAQRKDAVIVEMTAVFRHEHGREIALIWESFVEKFSELTTQQGERGEFARDQIATALRVNTAVPTEKLFRFRDAEFRRRHRELSDKADDSLNRIARDDPSPVEAFLRSREFTDLVSFYNNSFPWQPGRYNLEIGTRLLGSRARYAANTSMTLSQDEVDRIRGNLPLQAQRLEQIVRRVPVAEQVMPNHWITPEITVSSLKLAKR